MRKPMIVLLILCCVTAVPLSAQSTDLVPFAIKNVPPKPSGIANAIMATGGITFGVGAAMVIGGLLMALPAANDAGLRTAGWWVFGGGAFFSLGGVVTFTVGAVFGPQLEPIGAVDARGVRKATGVRFGLRFV